MKIALSGPGWGVSQCPNPQSWKPRFTLGFNICVSHTARCRVPDTTPAPEILYNMPRGQKKIHPPHASTLYSFLTLLTVYMSLQVKFLPLLTNSILVLIA
jgi:hypothetical protein